MPVFAESRSVEAGPMSHPYVDQVRGLTSPDAQLGALQNYIIYAVYGGGSAAELPAALADFAADTSYVVPAAVRIAALERAIERGVCPMAIDEGRREGWLYSAQDQQPLSYSASASRYLATMLMDQEGLDKTIWFPPWSDMEIDRGDKYPDYNPVYSFHYLATLEQELKGPQPSPEAVRFAPLLRDIHRRAAMANGFDQVPSHMNLEDWLAVHNCAALMEYGSNYRDTLAQIYEHNSGYEREYVRIISELTGKAKSLACAFPSRYRQGTEEGFRLVLADGLYAVLDHVANGGTTDTSLELNDNVRLPLQLRGSEPRQLLEALQTAVNSLTAPGFYNSRAVKVANSLGFTCLRLTDYRGMPRGINLYIRPEGAESFDPRLEYGRPGEGVEASISFVVDAGFQANVLTEVGKHRGDGDDKRISIRLDREGIAPELRGRQGTRRDPTTKQGTLSLDVGSIIGNDKWLSTRVGRFLAWGNVLRTREANQAATFNHVTNYFTAEDGDAQVFAEAAANLLKPYTASQLTLEEMRQLFRDR